LESSEIRDAFDVVHRRQDRNNDETRGTLKVIFEKLDNIKEQVGKLDTATATFQIRLAQIETNVERNERADKEAVVGLRKEINALGRSIRKEITDVGGDLKELDKDYSAYKEKDITEGTETRVSLQQIKMMRKAFWGIKRRISE